MIIGSYPWRSMLNLITNLIELIAPFASPKDLIVGWI